VLVLLISEGIWGAGYMGVAVLEMTDYTYKDLVALARDRSL